MLVKDRARRCNCDRRCLVNVCHSDGGSECVLDNATAVLSLKQHGEVDGQCGGTALRLKIKHNTIGKGQRTIRRQTNLVGIRAHHGEIGSTRSTGIKTYLTDHRACSTALRDGEAISVCSGVKGSGGRCDKGHDDLPGVVGQREQKSQTNQENKNRPPPTGRMCLYIRCVCISA